MKVNEEEQWYELCPVVISGFESLTGKRVKGKKAMLAEKAKIMQLKIVKDVRVYRV